jgi:hypothetical protein
MVKYIINFWVVANGGWLVAYCQEMGERFSVH